MIRRRGQGAQEEESSSDEDDAFDTLSNKAKKPRTEVAPPSKAPKTENTITSKPLPAKTLPTSLTSSMKRHHKPNDSRKAKMDALLEELEAEKSKVSLEPYRFIPEKKGSFVDPSEEHLTTNIFVGNLDPSISQKALTELFLQFGELYSIKIMWPRTPAERNRKRNTGFVCFVKREDAEEAMEACNEADPFNVGRQLMMRWGKSMKRGGPGGNVDHRTAQEVEDESQRVTMYNNARFGVQGDPNEIQLRPDGYGKPTSEQPHVVMDPQPQNPARISPAGQERGTETFNRKREYMTGRQIERARRGRRNGGSTAPRDGGTQLSPEEMQQFETLVLKQLSISRESICLAMAFCFEKSGSAKQIAELLRDALLDESPLIKVEMRIARLYLLSDILFNSQQPGVKNAFFYRDALEKMAPDIFFSLGRHGGGNVGRMTMNKLRKAVSMVLGAWTEWSVYIPTFLDELEARFEGKEIKPETPLEEVHDKAELPSKEKETELPDACRITVNQPRGGWTEVEEGDENADTDDPRSRTSKKLPDEGTRATSGAERTTGEESEQKDGQEVATEETPGKPHGHDETSPSEEHEGQEINENAKDKLDDDDIDGDPMEEDDIDGVPLEEGDEIDGEPIEESTGTSGTSNVPRPDGALAGDSLDGESLDGEELDGEELDVDDV